MSKNLLKNLFWTSLPLIVAVGCASTQSDKPAVYSELPERSVTPTSAQPAQRVYSGEENITPTAPPAGVGAEDWTLNERLRDLLTSDKRLAPYPSEVTAVVDQKEHGVVHLSGHVINTATRNRVHDAVAKLPGVSRVEDRMIVGKHMPTGYQDLRSAP
jgi:osmotically-inducible protein OsmY